MFENILINLGFSRNTVNGSLWQLDVEERGITIITYANLKVATVYFNGDEIDEVKGLENVLVKINEALI